MSDDTTRTDGWSASETTGSASEGAAQNDAPRVGFCQDCGRPLTQETLRTVGTGVFCEPCLTARVGATAPTSGYTTIPPYSAVPPQAATTSDPSPVLAGILGFIPGVGAMYNGQFAKGIVHLAIFVLLTFLANNVSGLCWIFCWGWIFYMAFEAYHTAVARRDGLPLPNAFGFNDIGERMGFGKSWSAAGTARPAGNGSPQNPPNQAPIVDTAGAYAPVNPVPVGTAPDWVGYVPPTAFAVPSPPSQGEPFAASQSSAAWGHTPYVETYTGASQPYAAAVPPTASPIQEPAARRFPTSAFWLIGLGVLILIANLLPDWKLTEQWWAPVFFAGLSVWLLMRRLRSGAKLVCIIRWPVVLMVLAVMLALHAAYFPVTFGLAFSVLLIVFGGLLFLERTAGAGPAYAPPVVAAPYSRTATVVDTQAEEARARTAWGTSSSNETNIDPDATKGGQ